LSLGVGIRSSLGLSNNGISLNFRKNKIWAALLMLSAALFISGCIYIPVFSRWHFITELSVEYPIDIASKNGFFYVLSRTGKVVVIDKTGSLTREIKLRKSIGYGATGIAINSDATRLYIANPSKGKVYVVSAQSGRKLKTIAYAPFKGEKLEDAKLEEIVDVALGRGGRLFMLDYKGEFIVMKKRLKLSEAKFDLSSVATKVNYPWGIAVWDREVWVTDTYSRAVKVYSYSEGTKTLKVVTALINKGIMSLRHPFKVSLTENYAFVTDTGWMPVVVYNRKTKKFIGGIGSFGEKRGKIMLPAGIASTEDGKVIAVGDIYRNKVLIFRRK